MSTTDIRVTGPNGAKVRVLEVSPIPGSGGTRFRVTTATWLRAGVYTVQVGPYVADVFGNALDGNENGVFLEATDAIMSTTRVDRDVYQPNRRLLTIDKYATSRITYSPIRVTTPTTIAEVAVEVNLRHAGLKDVSVSLIAPNGEWHSLYSNRNMTGADMVRVVFTDSAARIPSGSGPMSGEYRPYSTLSTLVGQSAQGTWRLQVHDNGTGEPGKFLSWNLYIKPQ